KPTRAIVFLYQDTTRLNRRITITRYESDDPTLGPRVPSTRAPAAPPTQLDAGALLLKMRWRVPGSTAAQMPARGQVPLSEMPNRRLSCCYAWRPIAQRKVCGDPSLSSVGMS